MKSIAHIKRYKEIGRLFWKYGRSDLARRMGEDGAIDATELESAVKSHAGPEDLAADLEAMGPTFIKLAQILSGRSDLLPVPYL
jgi:ubiquinone biosynthesis protein